MYSLRSSRPDFRSLLGTCSVCGGGYRPHSVRTTDLGRGAKDGCMMCTILLRGIDQLKQSLPREINQILKRCEYLEFDKDITDAYFSFRLKNTALNTVEDITLSFEVFLVDSNTETPPTHADVPSTLDLPRVLSVIRKWTSSCDRYHPLCAHVDKSQLPRRVLNISSREDEPVKLVELSGVYEPYIALSYCWGPAETTFKTTMSTMPHHLRGISFDAFPRVFQDVISICRALKIRYLWVDALCIIQDQTEDWELESAKMASIYSNSYMTIAASSCVDTSPSLFSDRWTSNVMPNGAALRLSIGSLAVEYTDYTFRLRPKLHLAHDRFVNIDNAHHHAEDAPLLTRAWAFQERLLPSRTLHFHAEELVWECKQGLRCECSLLDDTVLKAAEAPGREQLEQYTHSQRGLKSFLATAEVHSDAQRNQSHIWMNLVSEYTRLNLTYESDRLPALSGLAGKFQDSSLGNYLAGIWTNMLPIALLYESRWREGDFPRSPSEYRPQAPTWSWASIPLSGSNAISYDDAINSFSTPCTHFKVLHVTGKVLGKNPYGWVKNAGLRIRARSVKCLVVKNLDGSVALKRRASHMTFSEHEDVAALKLDGPIAVENNSRILLLYGGSGLGLALQKVSSRGPPELTTYRRIGLTKGPFNLDGGDHGWKDHMTVRDVDLI